MKRKLIAGLVLVISGYCLDGGLTLAKKWWDAPPSPPGVEAQKIVSSLQESNGWAVENRTEGKKGVWLVKGPVQVKACAWEADVLVNSADANSNFSSSDLKAINEAAKQCLRQLTVKGLSQTQSAGKTDGRSDSFVVNLPDGQELRISKKAE